LTWDEYAARWALLHGGVDPRRSSLPINLWLRMSYAVGRTLAGLRVPPGAVTFFGLLLSAAVPVFAWLGRWWLFVAAALVLLSAICDSADGATAVISSKATRLGAFYDALADRISEGFWLLGLWVLGVPGWLVVCAGGLAWLHEYARARATASGMADIGVVTIAERPTRVILVALAFALGGTAWIINPDLTPGAVTVVVAAWLVVGLLGAARLTNVIRSNLAHRPVP
jgi:CDP-diacylglycerol--glycerol-3-phosphate 3-phosphatidyltransferase